MKHPEFILALDKKTFGDLDNVLTYMDEAEFVKRANGSLVIARREELEVNEAYWQILPYIVMWQQNPDTQEIHVFSYRRTKGVGESRLLGKYSVGIGGHVDMSDTYHAAGVIDLRMTLAQAKRRELSEELLFRREGVIHTYDSVMVGNCVMPKFVGLLNDKSNAVGRVHLGLVYTHEVPWGFEPYCREKELETVGMIDPRSNLDIADFENWSDILIGKFEDVSRVM